MNADNRCRKLLWLGLCTVILFTGCAASTYINIAYRPQPATDLLQGRKLHVIVTDARTRPNVLGPKAQDTFEYFTGTYSLYVEPEGGPKALLGAYNLTNLFKAAMGHRLRGLGMTLLPEAAPGETTLEIRIKEFTLNLEGQTWKTAVDYDAELARDQQPLARETVTAKAERFRGLGRKEAEKVLSGLFSDCVNGLDIHRLFQRAAARQ